MRIAGFVGGYSGGFGNAIVAVTLCTFIPYDIQTLLDSLSISSFLFTMILLWISRSSSKIDWKIVLLIFVGALMGTPLGYEFLVLFGNQTPFTIGLGMVLILFGIMGIKSIEPKKIAKYWAVFIGIISGFLGGAFTINGPPVVMYLYSHTNEPQKLKATLLAIFLLMNIVRLSSLFLQAEINYIENIILLSTWTLPVGIMTSIIGHRLSLKHSSQFFRTVIYFLITGFGGIIFTKALMS